MKVNKISKNLVENIYRGIYHNNINIDKTKESQKMFVTPCL